MWGHIKLVHNSEYHWFSKQPCVLIYKRENRYDNRNISHWVSLIFSNQLLSQWTTDKRISRNKLFACQTADEWFIPDWSYKTAGVVVVLTCKLFQVVNNRDLKWLDPVIFWRYHPTLKLSGIPNFAFIVSLLYHAVSWQTRNNRKLPKHNLSQNAKNLQCLLKFGLIEDNVTVFQWPWNSEPG